MTLRTHGLPDEVRAFWESTQAALDGIPLDVQTVEHPEHSDDAVRVSSLSFLSWGRARIWCWVAAPRHAVARGILVQYPAYATVLFPPVAFADAGLIGVAVSVRGHHRSDADVSPGFPAFLTADLPAAETYVYRGVYCDAIRAIDAVRASVSPDLPILATGQSQGAVLALIAAALTDAVIAVGADVPFLCNIAAAMEATTAFPYRELRGYLRDHPDQRDQVLRTLRMFDACTYAPLVRCPTLVSIGAEDPVTPLAATRGLAARLPNVTVMEYPGAGHEGGGLPHRKLQLQWLLGRLQEGR